MIAGEEHGVQKTRGAAPQRRSRRAYVIEEKRPHIRSDLPWEWYMRPLLRQCAVWQHNFVMPSCTGANQGE